MPRIAAVCLGQPRHFRAEHLSTGAPTAARLVVCTRWYVLLCYCQYTLKHTTSNTSIHTLLAILAYTHCVAAVDGCTLVRRCGGDHELLALHARQHGGRRGLPALDPPPKWRCVLHTSVLAATQHTDVCCCKQQTKTHLHDQHTPRPTHLHDQHSDGMLHEAVLYVLKVAPTDPGPGYCRPYLQLFDPGWQGPAVAGRYGKLGIGEDPLGVLDRCDECFQGCPQHTGHTCLYMVTILFSTRSWCTLQVCTLCKYQKSHCQTRLSAQVRPGLRGQPRLCAQVPRAAAEHDQRAHPQPDIGARAARLEGDRRNRPVGTALGARGQRHTGMCGFYSMCLQKLHRACIPL